jgi:formate C-acetyltransferase
MSLQTAREIPPGIKQPHGLSERVRWLRDYYFKGVGRAWNNEFSCWTTGTPWDIVYDETTYYIVPETYAFFQTFRSSALQASRPVKLHDDFWKWSLVERRAWFIREVMVKHLPQEILPGDLLAGARFNILASRCWTKKEAKEALDRDRRILGRRGVRAATKWFHEHGYGNAGATSGHLVPDHPRVLALGWKGLHEDLQRRHDGLPAGEKRGRKGEQLRGMMTAATMPRDLAARYAARCRELAREETDRERRAEMREMAFNLDRVPWRPASNFWEAVQALWLNHMLIMSDENYPGPGVSFGRIDQYLYPYWKASLEEGMDREFGKEILKCFWIHANTAYDAMIKVGGNQGITSGFGQLITLSGMGAGGRDMTNDLTYAILEVIDEMVSRGAPRQGGGDDRLEPGCPLPAQLRREIPASRTPWRATTARARWTTT